MSATSGLRVIEFYRAIDPGSREVLETQAEFMTTALNTRYDRSAIVARPIGEYLSIATLQVPNNGSLLDHILSETNFALAEDNRNDSMTGVKIAAEDIDINNSDPSSRTEVIQLKPTWKQRLDDRHLEHVGSVAASRSAQIPRLGRVQRTKRAIELVGLAPGQMLTDRELHYLTLAGTHMQSEIRKINLGPLAVQQFVPPFRSQEVAA